MAWGEAALILLALCNVVGLTLIAVALTRRR